MAGEIGYIDDDSGMSANSAHLVPSQKASKTALNLKVPTSRQINSKDLTVDITLDKTDVGLTNVDNTSDANKPVSTAAQTALNAKEATISTGTTAQYYRGDKTWQTLPVAATWVFDMAPSRSIVTTAAAANGWQLSSTRASMASYSVNIATTATIGVASDGYVVMEIAATNSVTASDWKEVGRARSGQTLTLALVLQSVGNNSKQLMGIVPAGYYVRLRSVNASGTPTYTFVSGEEVLL